MVVAYGVERFWRRRELGVSRTRHADTAGYAIVPEADLALGVSELAHVGGLGGDEEVLGTVKSIERTDTVPPQSASFGLGGKLGKRRNRNKDNAGSRTRTDTGFRPHRILSPAKVERPKGTKGRKR